MQRKNALARMPLFRRPGSLRLRADQDSRSARRPRTTLAKRTQRPYVALNELNALTGIIEDAARASGQLLTSMRDARRSELYSRMDSACLLDAERKVFAIVIVFGRELDKSFYDLLASEARLAASSLSQGRRSARALVSHGRQMASVDGSRALIS